MTRRRARGLGLLLALSGAGVGCGDPAPEYSLEGESAAGPHPRWIVAGDPTLEIGVLAGEEVYQFESVSAGAVRSDGSVVIADARTGRVSVFDARGEFVRTLGEAGDGPGEFRSPAQLVVDARGGVTVWDGALWRSTAFDEAGALLDTEQTRLEALLAHLGPGEYPLLGALLPGGDRIFSLIHKGADTKAEAGAGRGTDESRSPSGVLRVDASGMRGEVVARLAGDEQVVVKAPWGPFEVAPPLGRSVHLAVHPRASAFCAGDQSAPRVTCWSGNSPPAEVTWEAPPRSVPAGSAAIRRWRDTTATLLGGKLAPSEVDRLLDQVPAPTEAPPYTGLVVDTEGRLWVEEGPARDGRVAYRVFDLEGVELGVARLPELRILEIGARYLLGVHTDEVGVEFVRRYGLEDRGPASS